MFSKFIKNFQDLPLSNKSMVYLMWIYGMGGVISGLFVNIFIFKLDQNIVDVISYNLVFFTFSFIGFSLIGYVMSLLKKDIKNMYYISYSLFILGFVYLLFFHNQLVEILLFAMIFGTGNGAFRCAVHSQELVHIADKKRDLYSSSISAGSTIIGISMPLVVSWVFFVSKILSFNGYIILFLFLPFLYITSFLFIKNIESYIPDTIKKADVKNFFNFKKYFFWLLYILWVSFYQGIQYIIWATIAIYLLKTEINVGLFEGIISLLSTVILIFLSHSRTTDNRIKIMGYLTLFLSLNYFLFVANFSIFWYLIYTIIGIIVWPLYRVSEHVYDLKIMDSIKYEGSDFFPAMILREVLLWIWRMFVMLIILYVATLTNVELQSVLKVGLILIPTFLIFTWCMIALHTKYEDTTNQ